MKRTHKIAFGLGILASALVLIAATPAGRIVATGAMNLAAARLDMTPNMDGARQRLESRLGSLPDPSRTRIVISKSARTAHVLDGETTVAMYPIALGPKPEGHKSREGDGRTPEGTYRLCTRLDRSRYHLFLGLSYPGPEDARLALAEGAITERTSDAVTNADANSGVPPWDSPLGGAVGLHGGGTGRDWTLGCIAFENEAIEEIWLLTQMGTRVEIGA
jgi:murein L,D-transpeptidase YafK